MLPFILLGLNLVPALIIVAIMVFTKLDELPISYAAYAGQTQMLLSVFAAAQAPILFSRDLRHGSIVLYLARPLRSSTYALMRWCSLTAALLVFLVTPIVLLFVGAVLSDADLTEQTHRGGWAALAARAAGRHAGQRHRRDQRVLDPPRLRGGRQHRRAAVRVRRDRRRPGHRL